MLHVEVCLLSFFLSLWRHTCMHFILLLFYWIDSSCTKEWCVFKSFFVNYPIHEHGTMNPAIVPEEDTLNAKGEKHKNKKREFE